MFKMIKTYSYLVKNTKKAHEVWNKHNPNNKIKGGKYKDVIHHIDRNRDNNDINNLQKMTHGEHARLHNTGNTYRKGIKISEEQKKKISEANKGNTFWLGRKHSEESKIKIGLASKGRKHSEETKKKISEAKRGNTNNLGRRFGIETRIKHFINTQTRKRDSRGRFLSVD
jgi:hypothetical protein